MLTEFLLAAAVLVALVNGNRCPNEDIELFDKNDRSKFKCWPFPKCNDGQEASVEPGSSHPKGTDIQCISCPDNFFSNNGTNKKCRNCSSCGNRKESLSCERSRDRQCSNSCISSEFYFNATDQQCHPCTECCSASDENIEPQCISMTIGTVIGGKGEKHCKASSKSSKRCDDLPSAVDKEQPNMNLSSILCGNSSLSNKSSVVESNCSQAFDRHHIGLVCALVVMTVLCVVLGWLACRKRRQSSRNDYLSSSESCPWVCRCFTGSSTCAGQRCDQLEMAPCINSCHSCQDKLKLIPEETKIDSMPYEVEDQLIKKLDAKRPRTKNWWDVGRKSGLSVSDLESVKRELDREDGSPTRCLISILSSQENVVSLRQFVGIIHSLGRHDICKAVCGWYQSQGNTA